MMISRKCYLLTFLTLPILSLAVDYPVGITNCGISSWIPSKPERAVTLNQGTTEVMLALKLSDRMVGTAYLDDEIWPELAEEYAKVPVLSERYPEPNQLLALRPDFLYGSYSSAFATSAINYTEAGVNPCTLVVTRGDNTTRTFCRQELHDEGIQTYLQTPYCELVQHKSEGSLDELRDEIWTIATIFDVLDNARTLIDSIENHFDQALEVTTRATADNKDHKPISVLWLDSWHDKTPFVGACCGAVQTILDHAGAEHVFHDLGREEKRSWASVSWEEIASRDPELIVLVDASWDTAIEKLHHLCQHPFAQNLRAVQNRAFLTVPFSGSTLGVRVGSLAYNLAEAMVALTRGRPLPSLEFSNVSISSVTDNVMIGAEAISRSGVKVFTRLPMYDGIDLHTVCPGTSANLKIRDINIISGNAEQDGNELSSWVIGLLITLGILLLAIILMLVFLVQREKTGNPLFQPIIKEGGATA